MGQQYEKYLPQVIDIAVEAASAILEIYNTTFSVEHKDDKTPLTEADMVAHKLIVSRLKQLTPDLPVLSEESAEISFAVRQQWDCYWLVDPLDGTREFIKGNGEFTVNIALIENGCAVLGVIQQPVSGSCYYAVKGQGAFKQYKTGKQYPIHVRNRPGDFTVVAGSRSHRDNSLDDFLLKIGNYELLPMGSSLKSCLVAEGAADIYLRLGPTSEWDTAAAQVIVEEAGGGLFDLSMQPLRYNTKDSLLNPEFLVVGDTSVAWIEYL